MGAEIDTLPTEMAQTTPAAEPMVLFRTEETIIAPDSLVDPPEDNAPRGARYLRGALLGSGGMGDVFTSRDQWIGRDVAMKTLRPDIEGRAGVKARFLREIRVQGQLEHPSVVPVYDFGVSAGSEMYFTMRRVKGATLGHVIERLKAGDEEFRRRFSRRKLLTAFSTICMTIHYAHSRGVVHRDLKPGNVMLGEFGEVSVLDWGIAKIVENGAAEDLVTTGDDTTGAGRVIGTIAYMSPEQANGMPVDVRSDVYSLGAILYEVLTLKMLMRETTALKALKRITDGIRACPSEDAPEADVPPELDAICLRATARTPDDRFASAKELSESVERYLDGDRDLERRKELAAMATEHANELLEQATSPDAPAEKAHAARLESLRVALRALGLDPDSRDALRTLSRLLLEPPREMPEAARLEHAKMREDERAAGAGLGFKAFFSYVLAFPLMAISGIRSYLLVGAGLAATIVAAAVARWIHLKKRVSSAAFLGLLSLCFCIVVLQSTWLGPFVLTPVAATITLSMFALYADRRERPMVLGFGSAMILAPFLAEIIPGVPPAFSFESGGVLLHPRSLELPRIVTVIGLVYTALGFALLPAIFLFRLRDTLRVAEDRTFLQAWTLRQLFPNATTKD